MLGLDADALRQKHDSLEQIPQFTDVSRPGVGYQNLLRSRLDGTLDDRLVSVTHYNGTPIAAENIVKPMLNGLFRYFTPTKPIVGASGGLNIVAG